MPIIPIQNTASSEVAQERLKKTYNNGDQDDNVRRAASAGASHPAAKEKDNGDASVRHVVEVQKKEGTSEVRRTIDKFV
ncbi:MAG: hypothetical protein AB1553_06100 [Nitrospirota bacterium]